MRLYCDPKTRQENSLSTNDVASTGPLRLVYLKYMAELNSFFHGDSYYTTVPHVAIELTES